MEESELEKLLELLEKYKQNKTPVRKHDIDTLQYRIRREIEDRKD